MPSTLLKFLIWIPLIILFCGGEVILFIKSFWYFSSSLFTIFTLIFLGLPKEEIAPLILVPKFNLLIFLFLFLVVFRVDEAVVVVPIVPPLLFDFDFDFEIDFGIKLCKNANSKVLFGLSVFNLSLL